MPLPADDLISAQDVLDGYGGFLAEGFRYATRDEVLGLWASAGLNGNGVTSAANIPGVTLLYDLMGDPFPLFNDSITGIYETAAGSGLYRGGRLSITRSTFGLPPGSLGEIVSAQSLIDATSAQGPGGFQQSFVGHYLVREAAPAEVPEPASAALVAISVGLVARRVRRQRPR